MAGLSEARNDGILGERIADKRDAGDGRIGPAEPGSIRGLPTGAQGAS